MTNRTVTYGTGETPVLFTTPTFVGVETGGKLTFNATITGPAGIIKVGPGMLEMQGSRDNDYLGATAINAGKLRSTSGPAQGQPSTA